MFLPSELLTATDAWLMEVCATLATFPNPVEVTDGIESWQMYAPGCFERLASQHQFSAEFLQSIFENSDTWKKVKSLALEDKAIAANIHGPTWWSFGSRGPSSLEDLFRILLPAPLLLGERYFCRHVEPDTASKFLDSLRAETFDSLTIWLVKGIEVNEPIKLEDNLSFRALSSHEKLQIIRQGVVRPKVSTRITENSCRWYGLCLLQRGAKYKDDDTGVTPPRIDPELQIGLIEDFIAALSFATDTSILHPGGLYFPPSIELSGLGTFTNCSWTDSRTSDPLEGHFTLPFPDPLMSANTRMAFENTWKLMRKSTSDESATLKMKDVSGRKKKQRTKQASAVSSNFNASMAMIIRRLYYAQTRVRPEDRLLDLMIAAEILYGDDNRNDKTHRLASSVALLAGGSNIERLQIYDDFKKAYRVRSSIVHGDTYRKSDVEEAIGKFTTRVRAFTKTLLCDHHLAERWPNWLVPPTE